MSLRPTGKPLKLEGKIAIVTGGGKGIGKALAKKLYEYGAKVVIADLCKEEATSAAKHMGGIGFKCDVTQERQIKTLVSKVKKKFGPIDIFVNAHEQKPDALVLSPAKMRIQKVFYLTD